MTQKPFPRIPYSTPERLEKRKRMTIAAGFVCKDGIVICADSEETQSYIRTSVDKLVIYDEDWCKAALAGSGNGDLVDALIEKIFEKLDAVQPENIASAKTEIEETILTFHEKEIFYHPSEEDRVLDLIIGIKPKQTSEAFLWKVHGPALSTVQDKHVIGSGTMVRQIAEQLYRPSHDFRHGVLVAANILYQAKRHVRGCGGWSRITGILNSGAMESKQFLELVELEEYLRQFDDAVHDLFFCCADPNEESFASEFEAFKKKIAEARQSFMWGYELFMKHKDEIVKPHKKRKR